MKLGYIILYVNDVHQTMNFYIQAFGFTKKMITPEEDYVEINTGDTTLAFANYSVAEYNGVTVSPGSSYPIELAFVTDDVTGALQQSLDAGAVLLKDCEDKPRGQTVAYVQDINGFLIELCSPV